MHAQNPKEHNDFFQEISFVFVEITFFRLNFFENSPKENTNA
jgi:hypothetical protein